MNLIKKNGPKNATVKIKIVQLAFFQLWKIRRLELDKDKKIYALKEKKIDTPVLFVYLPLGISLAKKPLFQIDGKNILNLNFSHCDLNVGCSTNVAITDEIIKLFKSGKELNIIAEVYGKNKNVSIKLPLKGFTKSYDSF